MGYQVLPVLGILEDLFVAGALLLPACEVLVLNNLGVALGDQGRPAQLLLALYGASERLVFRETSVFAHAVLAIGAPHCWQIYHILTNAAKVFVKHIFYLGLVLVMGIPLRDRNVVDR